MQRLFGSGQTGTETAPEQAAVETPGAPGIGDLLNLGVRLALVAGGIYLAVWMLRRWMRRRRGALSTSGRVRVLDTISLSTQRLLYVVDLGDKVVLLGATLQQLSLIAKLTDPDTIASFRTNSEGKVILPGRLQAVLSRLAMPASLRTPTRGAVAAPQPTPGQMPHFLARLN